MRIHELAEEFGVSSRDVLSLLQQIGEPVTSPSARVDPGAADWLREEFKRLRDADGSPSARPARSKPARPDALNDFSDRMQAILQKAEEEAEETRAKARVDADKIRQRARAEADQILGQAHRDRPMVEPGWFVQKDDHRLHRYWDGNGWHKSVWTAPDQVFVSYARADSAIVHRMASELRSARLNVWLDEQLATGEEWWTQILQAIRGTAVVVHALSASSVRSAACRAECDYARELGIPIIPLRVADMDLRTSPYGRHHVIDYGGSGALPRLVADVVRAGRGIRPPAGHVPDPPPAPFGYLLELVDRLSSSELTRTDQTTILHTLIDRLDEESEASVRRDLLGLVRRLVDRSDAARSTVNLGERILASTSVDDGEND